MSFIYLASPYSHPNATVRHERFTSALRCAANLYRAGKTVFSPIVHYHPIHLSHDMPTDHGFWKPHNENMLRAASGLYVLDIDGWQDSEGTRHEVEMNTEFARDHMREFCMVSRLGETYMFTKPETW